MKQKHVTRRAACKEEGEELQLQGFCSSHVRDGRQTEEEGHDQPQVIQASKPLLLTQTSGT